MNPRQRRGVLLLVIAAAGAILVFALVSSYVADVRKDVDPKTSVVVLGRPVPALQPIPPDALVRKEVPAKYAPTLALHEPLAVGDRVPAAPLPAGIELQQGMLVDPPEIQRGQQEVSILISADTGVAGKIRPGDRVDVNATFAGDDRSLPSARKVLVNARIITIGVPQQSQQAFQPSNGADNRSNVSPASLVVPVTFALKPLDVLRLQYAETNAQQIRLSLVRPDDPNKVGKRSREFELPPSRIPKPQTTG